MNTHNKCFCAEISRLFVLIPLLTNMQTMAFSPYSMEMENTSVTKQIKAIVYSNKRLLELNNALKPV